MVLVALLDFRDRDVRACTIFSWLTRLSFLLDLLLLVNVLVSLESVDEVLSIAHFAQVLLNGPSRLYGLKVLGVIIPTIYSLNGHLNHVVRQRISVRGLLIDQLILLIKEQPVLPQGHRGLRPCCLVCKLLYRWLRRDGGCGRIEDLFGFLLLSPLMQGMPREEDGGRACCHQTQSHRRHAQDFLLGFLPT